MKSAIRNLQFIAHYSLLVAFVIFGFLFFAVPAHAASVLSPDCYAWNDVVGWFDFCATGNVTITNTQLTGYASSSVGYIGLDCATTPNGDICGGAGGSWKVANDGNGNLSGWAWNDGIGWISFDSVTAGSSYTYQVTVNPSTGQFSGWAWNDIAGWISFNCSNTGTCGTVDYLVATGWSNASASGTLVSSTFDTMRTSGATLNSVIWQGSKPSGTNVQLQIASSDSSSGSWTYAGPDCTSASYYSPTGPDAPVEILQCNTNKRYFRYKIYLYTNSARTATPTVNDVIINWSP